MGWVAHIETVITVDGEDDRIEQTYPAEYCFSEHRQVIEYYEVSEEGERTLVRVESRNGGLSVTRPEKNFILDLGAGVGRIDYDNKNSK